MVANRKLGLNFSKVFIFVCICLGVQVASFAYIKIQAFGFDTINLTDSEYVSIEWSEVDNEIETYTQLENVRDRSLRKFLNDETEILKNEYYANFYTEKQYGWINTCVLLYSDRVGVVIDLKSESAVEEFKEQISLLSEEVIIDNTFKI